MTTIIVKWVPNENKENFVCDMLMLVIKSTHKRFKSGSRFDFGFFKVATKEGYTITSLPMDETIEEDK